jgi:hypothetical protein
MGCSPNLLPLPAVKKAAHRVGCWGGVLCPPAPHLLSQSGELTLGVMRSGELTLSLTHCSTRESGPCNLLGQHSRSGFGQSVIAPWVRPWENWPCHSCALWWSRYRVMFFPYPPQPPKVVKKAGPKVLRVGELDSPIPSLVVAHGRTGPAPCLGNTVGLALMVKAQFSQLQEYEKGRPGLAPCRL